MRVPDLLHFLAEGAPDCPKLYLDRSEGTAVFAARRSEARDELLSRLPGGTGTPFKVEGRDGVVFVVVAPISRVGRALQALRWGEDRGRAPPQPAPQRPPQRHPPQRRPSDVPSEEAEPTEAEPEEARQERGEQ